MNTPAQITPSAIDHLGVVGRDITALITAYTRLGFTPTDPVPLMGMKDGAPVPLGQESAHLIFADSYVELSGVTSTDPGHHLAPFLARYHGLHILALGTGDAAASHAALTAQGFETPPVQNAGRHVDYGTRHGDAAFKWFKAPEALGEEAFVCLVEQVTPELVFQPPADGHPNGANGVSGVLVLCHDVAETMQRFAAYPGAQAAGEATLDFNGQTLTFFTDAGFAKAFCDMGEVRSPALAGFSVRTPDIAATRAWLDDRGVTCGENDFGLWVGPDQGCGSVVVFEAA
jgi:hypothetical protein